MNENRCPQCDLLNLPSAARCLQCNTPLSISPKTFSEQKTAEFPHTGSSFNEAKTTEFSNDAANYSQPVSFDSKVLPTANQTGSRTYFWYRMLCSVIVVSNIVWAIIGAVAILGSFNQPEKEAADAFGGGLFMIISGGVPALLFLFGVILPPRSWTWIFGILLLALALVSCVFSPFAILLLIFWVKPETQIFFGRN